MNARQLPLAGTAPEPPAPEDAEAALWRALRSNGSPEARKSLFSLHAPFARSMAIRHYRHSSYGDVDVGDLQQLAYTGLLEALDRFDPTRGVPFRGYAASRISGSIRDGLGRMSEMREQMSWRRRLQRERIHSLSTQATDGAQIGDAAAALADLAVGLALGFMLEGTGLVEEPEPSYATADMLSGTAYSSAAWNELTVRLVAELALLPEREQAILRRHYGDGLSFDNLAALLGIGKSRVSQLHRSALGTLRKRMAAKGHFGLGR